MRFSRPISLQRIIKLMGIFLLATIIRQMMHFRSASSHESPDLPQFRRFAANTSKSAAVAFNAPPVSREPGSTSSSSGSYSTPRSTRSSSAWSGSSGTTLPAFRQRAIDRVKKIRFYDRFVTDREHRIMLSLLNTIDHVFRHYNTTYIIYGGTLLGSYRHHGLIPWDDDIDLLVNKSCRNSLTLMLKKLAPGLTLYPAGGHDKISHALSVRTNQYPWRWPYLDVSYFEENSTHVWDHMPTYSHWFVYPKYLTLPTHLRPFDSLWLPAPRDTLAFLQLTYGRTGTCLTSGYSHMIESGMSSDRRLCSQLKEKISFVHRRPCSGNDANFSSPVACVREFLQLGGTVLQTLLVSEPSFAISEPYYLRLTGGFTQPPGYPTMSDADL